MNVDAWHSAVRARDTAAYRAAGLLMRLLDHRAINSPALIDSAKEIIAAFNQADAEMTAADKAPAPTEEKVS